MHIDVPQVQNETLFAWRICRQWQRINNYWGGGGWSRSVLLCCWTFGQSFLQSPCSPQPMQVSVLLGVLVNLKGLLKGLLSGLFALYPNFVFVGIGGEYPFWKLAFQNWKLGALEIVDENDCVKLADVFTFLFLVALCSACLIFCASSESFAMGSCSYSCTIDHPVGDRSTNLISLFVFFSFVAIDVKLADRSSVLPLHICCWFSYMAKEIFVLKSNWSLLPFAFMWCPSGLYFSAGGSMFLLIWACIPSIFCRNSWTSNSKHLLVLFPPRILEKYVFEFVFV